MGYGPEFRMIEKQLGDIEIKLDIIIRRMQLDKHPKVKSSVRRE